VGLSGQIFDPTPYIYVLYIHICICIFTIHIYIYILCVYIYIYIICICIFTIHIYILCVYIYIYIYIMYRLYKKKKKQFIPSIKAYSEEWGQGMQPCAGHSLDYSKPSNLTNQKPCTAVQPFSLQGYKNRPSQYKLWHLRVILHHLTSSINSVLMVPSGKRLHNYAKSPCYENG
jgi:Ca2+/Na+ antiporter